MTKLTNYVLNQKTGQFVETPGEPTEWWSCDGKSIFEVRDKPQKLVVERPLPPEMYGKAITDGPLPFVFGAKAEVLKIRYYMRIIPPAANAAKRSMAGCFPKNAERCREFFACDVDSEKGRSAACCNSNLQSGC